MICLFLDFVSVPNFLLSPSLLRSPLSFASQSTTQFVQKNLWNATQQFNKTLKGRKLSSNTSFKYDRQRLLSSLTFIFQKWSDPLSVWRSWSTSTNRSLEEHWTLKKNCKPHRIGTGLRSSWRRSAPLVRWSPRVRARAYQSLFKPFQVDPKPSKSTLQWKKPCEPKIVTPERQPHPSHKRGSPHRRREPLHARKHRASRDFKPPNITLTQQFHSDLQSLPRKSHCNDNVLW
jgi:hypothetical protein